MVFSIMRSPLVPVGVECVLGALAVRIWIDATSGKRLLAQSPLASSKPIHISYQY